MPVIVGADFSSTHAIIHDFLFVPQVSEICSNHGTKLVVV
jgi:hypothetical protein